MTEKAKQTAQAAESTEAKYHGPVVYCGPTVKNMVKQYTVFCDNEALPAVIKKFLANIPMAQELMVPLDDFAATRTALETPKSGAAIKYAAVKAAIEKN